MKRLLLLCLFFMVSHATDYSNMFYTSEPFNPYNLETQKEFSTRVQGLERSKESEALEDNTSKLANYNPFDGAVTSYRALFGMVWQFGFDSLGNEVLLGVEHTLPHAIENYHNFFVQADVSLMLIPLRDSIDTGHSASYAYIAGYGGYSFDIDDKTAIKPRFGISILAPTYNFIFAGAVTIERAFDDDFDMLADISVMNSIFFVSLGVKYTYITK